MNWKLCFFWFFQCFSSLHLILRLCSKSTKIAVSNEFSIICRWNQWGALGWSRPGWCTQPEFKHQSVSIEIYRVGIEIVSVKMPNHYVNPLIYVTLYFSSNINIHTRSSMDIQAGQRLCVSGKLKSESVQLTEGKTIQRTTIKANRLFAMENDSAASLCGDVNRVELLANVANDIFHSEKYSVFTVATNFTTL